jgi:hypothetical protein
VYKFICAFCLLIPTGAALAEGRDPTLPANLPTDPTTSATLSDASLQLTAIFITDTGNRAIINGVTLKPGQSLDDDTRLLHVLPGRVIVRQRDAIKTLVLVPSVKMPPKR